MINLYIRATSTHTVFW